MCGGENTASPSLAPYRFGATLDLVSHSPTLASQVSLLSPMPVSDLRRPDAERDWDLRATSSSRLTRVPYPRPHQPCVMSPVALGWQERLYPHSSQGDHVRRWGGT